MTEPIRAFSIAPATEPRGCFSTVTASQANLTLTRVRRTEWLLVLQTSSERRSFRITSERQIVVSESCLETQEKSE
jgi:hypothetical protein